MGEQFRTSSFYNYFNRRCFFAKMKGLLALLTIMCWIGISSTGDVEENSLREKSELSISFGGQQVLKRDKRSAEPKERGNKKKQKKNKQRRQRLKKKNKQRRKKYQKARKTQRKSPGGGKRRKTIQKRRRNSREEERHGKKHQKARKTQSRLKEGQNQMQIQKGKVKRKILTAEKN